MNKINVKVVDIKESGDLCHLFLSSGKLNLGLVMLANHFKKGDEIVVGFKESAVAVSRNGNRDLSYSNQISVEIESILEGEILTKVVGKTVGGEYSELKITSVITASSAKRLELKVGDKVTFLVKATDMFVV